MKNKLKYLTTKFGTKLVKLSNIDPEHILAYKADDLSKSPILIRIIDLKQEGKNVK